MWSARRPASTRKQAVKRFDKESSTSQLAASRNHHLDLIGKRRPEGGASEARSKSKISVDLDCVAISLQNAGEDEQGWVDRCGTLTRTRTGTDKEKRRHSAELIPHKAGFVSADFMNKWSVDGEEVLEDDLEESFAQRPSARPPVRPALYHNPILKLPNEFQGGEADPARNCWGHSRLGMKTIQNRRSGTLPRASAVATPPGRTQNNSPAKPARAGLVNYEFVTDDFGQLQIERKQPDTAVKSGRAQELLKVPEATNFSKYQQSRVNTRTPELRTHHTPALASTTHAEPEAATQSVLQRLDGQKQTIAHFKHAKFSPEDRDRFTPPRSSASVSTSLA